MTMADVLFLLLWFVIPFVWCFVLRLGGMRIMTLSLPSFVVAAILVFQYVGLPILYFSLDDYRAEYVTDQGLLQRFAKASADARSQQLDRLVASMPMPHSATR